MDEQKRASLLDDLAVDANRRREEFLADAGRAFVRFLDANRHRLHELGGLVLIDDEPDYLFVTEEGTFRSRSRFQDDDGRWVVETEEYSDPAELVEVFNPADLYAAFADAAEAEAAGEATEAAGESLDEDGAAEAAEEDIDEEAEPGPDFDEPWLEKVAAPETTDEAARMLYDLALTFQERSQLREAQLLDDFWVASENLAAMVGDTKIVEDEDERIWFRGTGTFEGEVVPESDDGDGVGAGETAWQTLTTPDDFVQFYDPTDLFGDLAEALADRYPQVAPELNEAGAVDDELGRDD